MAPAGMPKSNPMPTVHDQDVKVRRNDKVHRQQSSSQKAAMPTVKSEVREESQVHSPRSILLKVAVPKKEWKDSVMTEKPRSEGQSQGQPLDDTCELQITSTRKLRSGSERRETTVENNKAKIEAEGSKASSVDEDLARAELLLQTHQSKLEDAQNKLIEMEEDFQISKGQLTGMRKVLAASRRELQESKGKSRNMTKVNKDLRKDLKASQEELDKCKDDLFSLQRVAQIPDSTISERFTSIGQQMVHWIDTEVAAFEKAHPEAEPDDLFSVGENRNAIKFLRRHPRTGEHLARYLIYRFLQFNVFGKNVYFIGMPEETVQFLRKVEVSMAGLDQPKDSVTIASWRSETLKAFAETTECKYHCQQQSLELNTRMFTELSQSLPTFFSGQQRHATFYEQVLLPAVKLANLIRISTSDYVTWIPESLVTNFRPATMDLLKVHKMVDSKSGMHLKPDSAVVSDKDGIIGKFIIFLEPGLGRMCEGKKMTLHQGAFLVELDHPLGKRMKASTYES